MQCYVLAPPADSGLQFDGFLSPNNIPFEIKNQLTKIIFRCRIDLTTNRISEGNHESFS